MNVGTKIEFLLFDKWVAGRVIGSGDTYKLVEYLSDTYGRVVTFVHVTKIRTV